MVEREDERRRSLANLVSGVIGGVFWTGLVALGVYLDSKSCSKMYTSASAYLGMFPAVAVTLIAGSKIARYLRK